MSKITKIHTISFSDVLENKGGSKHQIKLPSYIEKIISVAFYIKNPLFVLDDAIPGRYSFVIHNFFDAIKTSLILFNENNSIFEYRLLNNEFWSIELLDLPTTSVATNYKLTYNMDISKIELPINKKNLHNSYSTVVFKKTDNLDYYLSSLGASDWKPDVEMIIKYK